MMRRFLPAMALIKHSYFNKDKYALYIGRAEDILDIKTANGFSYWFYTYIPGAPQIAGIVIITFSTAEPEEDTALTLITSKRCT